MGIDETLRSDKKTAEFFMAMIPPTKTHQEKQVRVMKGKPIFYEPQELKETRSKLEAHLVGHVPAEKYTGAVRLITKWCFPITGNHHDGEYRTTRPDTDNLQKMLKDVMTHLGYWADDARVASEIIEKFWAEIPGIYIRIEELCNRI
jgi:Holliday junction resolvase RusA-like endonuclease